MSRRVKGSKSRSNKGKVENGSGNGKAKPNELSEELLKCLISIFLELNQATTSMDKEGSAIVPKINLSCMNSKGFIGKTQFINCKSPTFLFNLNSSPNVDPYGILPDLDGSIRDIGPYKNFIQLTSSSLDITRFPECLAGIRKLRFARKILQVNDYYICPKKVLIMSCIC